MWKLANDTPWKSELTKWSVRISDTQPYFFLVLLKVLASNFFIRLLSSSPCIWMNKRANNTPWNWGFGKAICWNFRHCAAPSLVEFEDFSAKIFSLASTLGISSLRKSSLRKSSNQLIKAQYGRCLKFHQTLTAPALHAKQYLSAHLSFGELRLWSAKSWCHLFY